MNTGRGRLASERLTAAVVAVAAVGTAACALAGLTTSRTNLHDIEGRANSSRQQGSEKNTSSVQETVQRGLMCEAVEARSKKKLEDLIGLHGDVNGLGYCGRAPLHLAAGMGQLDIVRLLLKKQADVNVKSVDGETPLHYAVREKQLDVVKTLLDGHAKIDSSDDGGRTPLHAAASGGELDIVVELLARGAVVYVQDEEGCTPLDYAKQRGFEEIVSKLQAASGKNSWAVESQATSKNASRPAMSTQRGVSTAMTRMMT